MKKLKYLFMALAIVCGVMTTSCNNDEKPTFPETEGTDDPTGCLLYTSPSPRDS